MRSKRRPALASILTFLAKVCVALFCILAIGLVQIHIVAPSISRLDPEVLAEPDAVVGEPSEALMMVWNALPVLPMSQQTIGRAVKRGKGNEQLIQGLTD